MLYKLEKVWKESVKIGTWKNITGKAVAVKWWEQNLGHREFREGEKRLLNKNNSFNNLAVKETKLEQH